MEAPSDDQRDAGRNTHARHRAGIREVQGQAQRVGRAERDRAVLLQRSIVDPAPAGQDRLVGHEGDQTTGLQLPSERGSVFVGRRVPLHFRVVVRTSDQRR